MDSYLAEIRLFAGNFAPTSWAFCNGALLSIQNNTPLYALIGTIYGGDGQNTFALPDFRGRVPVGSGQGPGLSNYTLGEMSGSESVTLTNVTMGSHSHTATGTIKAIDSAANQISPANNFLAQAVSGAGTDGNSYTTKAYSATQNTTMSSQVASGSTGAAGGSQPHPNIMLYTAMNYIIAVEGIFPSRN